MKQKMELKIKSNKYHNIGKTPGILVEENKRRKLLRELGVSAQIEEQTSKLLSEAVNKEAAGDEEPRIEEEKKSHQD